MGAHRLTIQINGREAVPVRAIPHVAIDERRVSPDEIAETLAGKEQTPRIQLPQAYHWCNGNATPIDAREWNDVSRLLDGLKAELRRKFGHEADGDAEWLRQATDRLPAGVFFWLDEFQNAWNDYMGEWSKSQARQQRAVRGAGLDNQQEQILRSVGTLQDAPRLNFAPMRSAELADMIFAGFAEASGAEKAPEEKSPSEFSVASDETTCMTVELIRNDELIDWQYWKIRDQITADDAAKLSYCIDPIKWPNGKSAQGPIPEYLRERIERRRALLAERCEKWNLVSLVEALGADAAPFSMRKATRNQMADSVASGHGLAKRERQIRAIECVADALEFKRQSIPDKGKARVLKECRAKHKDLFGVGADPFKEAWQEAVNQGRIRMANHEKFARR